MVVLLLSTRYVNFLFSIGIMGLSLLSFLLASLPWLFTLLCGAPEERARSVLTLVRVLIAGVIWLWALLPVVFAQYTHPCDRSLSYPSASLRASPGWSHSGAV